jgi:hypothetical protein
VNKLWKKNDLFVYFLSPHEKEDQIISWANEWSKYCAIIFHQTLKQETSDIRVDFKDGMYVGVTDDTVLKFILVLFPELPGPPFMEGLVCDATWG